jgi:hypothetical protein
MKIKLMKNYLLLFLFLIVQHNSAQKVIFFPSALNIKPFTANTLEANLGFQFKLNSNELLLNIGNSIDVLHFNCGNGNISVGADLFTWTLLRKEDNFHFPVDAVDYQFGINFGYINNWKSFSYGFRGRISHISAHFVDGHYEGVLKIWRDGLNPRVYSREFVELLPFIKYRGLRFYAGFTYLFNVDPSSIKKDNYQLGFDYYFKNRFTKYFTPYIGYDLRIVHLDEYSGNNSFVLGIKFGKVEGRGLSLQYNYYSGKSLHGEYFNYTEKFSSLGLKLDL